MATLDPFANAANKAPRTLKCLPMKSEQMQIVFWSVGRDVFAVLATGFVALCSAVPQAAFDLRQSWWSPINCFGFIDPHRRHKRLGWCIEQCVSSCFAAT